MVEREGPVDEADVMDAIVLRPDLITDGHGIGSVTVMVDGRACQVVVVDDQIRPLARRWAAQDAQMHPERLADVLDPMPIGVTPLYWQSPAQVISLGDGLVEERERRL